jgi:streptogramin lyase
MGPFVAPGAGGLDTPHNPTFGPDGHLYVVSNGSGSIKRFDGITGEFIDDFVPSGSGGFAGSSKLAFGPDGNLYAVANSLGLVLRFSGLDGGFLGVAAQGQGMTSPCGIAFGADGRLYVLDNPSFSRVLRFDIATDEFEDEFVGTGRLFNACDITFGPDGNLYVTDINARNVQFWDGQTGEYLGVFCTMPAGQAGPSGLVFGPDGNLYVNNGNTLQFDGVSGAFLKVFVAGNGGFPNFLPYLTSDEPLPAGTFAVTNTRDSGPGSLRQAIQNANLNFQGASRIVFNIPGEGVQSIVPLTDLPAMTQPTEIDGFTQPGSAPNSLAEGIDALLRIELRGKLRVVGNSMTIRGLVVNSSGGTGLELIGMDCRIEGCFIGTDPTGTVDLGNELDGLHVSNSAGDQPNYIGGPDPAQRTLISGNQASGITIQVGPAATIVQGNHIGTDVTGRRRLGNAGFGVRVFGSTTLPTVTMVGGTNAGEGNRVAFNNTGVWVATGGGVTIRGNAIFENVGLGIDLGSSGSGAFLQPDGWTPNDASDADTGANGLQNYPVIGSLIHNGGSSIIQGSLDSNSNSTYQIDLFSNPRPDAHGLGEGQEWLGMEAVTTDASGAASFSVQVPTSAAFVSATATDEDGNTSEFALTYFPEAGSFAPGDLFVTGTHRIVQWFGAGGALKGVLRTDAPSQDTYGLAFGSDDDLYVTGRDQNVVTRFDPEGNRIGTFAGGHDGRSWLIRFDDSGRAYVANAGGTVALRQFDAEGNLLGDYDVALEGFLGLTTIDLAGDQRTLFHAFEGRSFFGDVIYQNRVRRFDLGANQPLPDFAAGLPGNVRGLE